MKKIIALTLLLIVALAAPALGALKMLEASLAAELEGMTRQHIAAEAKVELAKVTVSEAWVRELHNIGKDIYIVITLVGENKFETYVDVAKKAILSTEAFEALVAENTEKEPEEPVFRTMSLGAPEATDDTAVITGAPEQAKSKLPYVAAGIGAILAMGAGAFVLKTRLN